MSEYTTVEMSGINNEQCLTDALTELGINFTVHEKPSPLMGHRSRQREAHIVISREELSRYSNKKRVYGDVGFLRNKNGEYSFVVDVADRNRLNLNMVKRTYLKNVVLRKARQTGLVVRSQRVDENGQIRIRLLAG